MPLYGDVDQCKIMLRATEGAELGDDITARLTAIQAAISLQLEEECGRTWGEPVSDTSRLMWATAGSGILVLDVPARSITSIRTGGDLAGSTMTGGDVTLAADLSNRFMSHQGLIYGITAASNGWWPYWQTTSRGRYPVLVTGDFADTDNDADVPADVTYAANVLIVDHFKMETASPAGFTGPDGATVPIRNPWHHPAVKGVIEKYSLRRQPLVV